MTDIAPSSTDGEVVFIADDDEDLLIEHAEWQQAESTTFADEVHVGQIQLQLRMCFAAMVLLPMLAALIALAWRHFGDAISRASTEQADEQEKKKRR